MEMILGGYCFYFIFFFLFRILSKAGKKPSVFGNGKRGSCNFIFSYIDAVNRCRHSNTGDVNAAGLLVSFTIE